MSALPERFGLYVLVLCLVLALMCVVVGTVLLVRSALRLKRHFESYGDLPLGKTLELTQARIDAALQRADSIPSTLRRAHAALTEMETAGGNMRLDFSSVGLLVRAAGAVFNGR